MQSGKRKAKKILTPEEIYDQGVNIFNRLLDTDLTTLAPKVLVYDYAMAVDYIKDSIDEYRAKKDEPNVIATYKMLVKFYEKNIADELIDLAHSKVAANELPAAILYFKLANCYYSKAVYLKQYSRTPELELHFSVLNALDQLIIVDPDNQDFYRQNIADYMAEYNITQLVNNFSEQAVTYQKMASDYQRLGSTIRKSYDAMDERPILKKPRTENIASLDREEMPKPSQDVIFTVPELEHCKLVINNFINQASSQLDQTAVHQLLTVIGDFYRINTLDMHVLCLPIGLPKKRDFAMQFYQLSAALGNNTAGEALLSLQRIYSKLTQYNIFSKTQTYRYDNDLQNKFLSDNNIRDFSLLGGAKYLKQILVKHADEMFLAGDKRVFLILEQCAHHLGKTIAAGTIFTTQKDQLAQILMNMAPAVPCAENTPPRLTR